MSLRADIQTDVADAFDTDLSDAVKTLSLVKSSTSYNITTGVNTPVGTTYATRGVLDSYRNREFFDKSIEPTDVNAIILANELAATPEIDDYIKHGILKYKIIAVVSDPADAHWELQCRL